MRNYSSWFAGAIIWAFILLALYAFILFLSSCNAYKGISKKQPVSNKDSIWLAERFSATFPPPPPKFIQGKTTIKEVLKEDTRKSKFLTHLVDSLNKAGAFKDELLDNIPNIDSIVSELEKECLKNCPTKIKEITIHQTDTIEIVDSKTKADLFIALNNGTRLSEANERQGAKIKDYEADRDSLKWVVGRFFALTWWFWTLLIVGTGGYFYFFKIKKKVPFI